MKSEQSLTDASRRFADSIQEVVTDAPGNIRKFVDDAFDVMEAIVRSRREFAHDVVGRLLGEVQEEASKTAEEPKKPHARKAPPRKTAAA